MSLKILYASSEVMPFAKTGGLADVAEALPCALKKLGHDVRVVTPLYQCTRKGPWQFHKIDGEIFVPLENWKVRGEIYEGALAGNVPVYFIGNTGYFDRENIYGTQSGDYSDNASRFIFFSKAILAVAEKLDFTPDIIHCNDWQTGLPMLLLAMDREGYSFFAKTSTVFTIHNIAYQGVFARHDLPLTNLGWEVFNSEVLEYYGNISLLKAGIVGADTVTTVSKKYAQEIQTQDLGFGMEGVVAGRKAALHGILNGVDYKQWSPEKGPFLAAHYSADKLEGKKTCRAELLKEFNLILGPRTPLFAMISRLADQKGWDLLAAALDDILAMDCGMIVLGTGDEKYHRLLETAKEKYPQRMGLHLGFDNALAHRIEGGADIFLMPSRFEPCGLNQIYSMGSSRNRVGEFESI